MVRVATLLQNVFFFNWLLNGEESGRTTVFYYLRGPSSNLGTDLDFLFSDTTDLFWACNLTFCYQMKDARETDIVFVHSGISNNKNKYSWYKSTKKSKTIQNDPKVPFGWNFTVKRVTSKSRNLSPADNFHKLIFRLIGIN